MKADRKKPAYVARNGNVRVPVYHQVGRGTYTVAWRQVSGGPRVRKTFTVKKEATEKADEIAKSIADSLADVVTLSSADRDSYRLSMQKLAPFCIPLHAAIDELVAARALIPGRTVLEAAERLKAEIDAAAFVCPPSAEIVAALMADLRTDPHRTSKREELARVEARLKAVAEKFPDLRKVDHDDADKFLRELKGPKGEPLSAKTRDHYLAAAKRLIGYATRRGWLPEGAHGFSRLKKVFKAGAVKTFSVAELKEIVKVCSEKWIPYVVIGAFAGLRSAEIGRLTWDAIRWDENEIALGMSITKTGRPRNVPIEPNLRAWLLPRAKKVGRIYSYGTERSFEKAVQKYVIAAIEDRIENFEWKDNGLRHSYGSYLYGRERNLATVRAHMGNTDDMVMRFYNDPKTKAEGLAWFGIQPDGAEKITPIAAAPLTEKAG